MTRPFKGTTYYEMQVGPLVIQRRIYKERNRATWHVWIDRMWRA